MADVLSSQQLYWNNFVMLNIEDLIRQIIASPVFKHEMQAQLKECMQEREEPVRQASHVVTLPQLVEEINGYISQITEMALEQENSKNYIAFMKKNEDYCREMEKKINSRMHASLEQLDSKMQAMTLRFNQLAKTTKKVGTDGYRLKNQRKMITQSILQTSRIQNSSNIFSPTHTKSQVHFSKEVNSYEELGQSNDTNSSLSLQMDKLKYAQIQKQCKKCLQAWWSKVENVMEGLRQAQQKMKQQCTEQVQKAQAKLDGNLESIWNVISDLCSRISKIQSFQVICQANNI